MSQTKTKKSWPEIGTLRKSEDGTSYIKLGEGVDIFVNGEKVNMNDKRVVKLEDPRKKVEQMFERGFIDESKRDQRLEKLAEMSWLRYTLVVAPPK